MLKLYGSYTSPFVRHCRIILDEFHVDHEFINTDYQQSAEWSVTHRVPFMEFDEGRLSDSSSIIQYLRYRLGQPFLASPSETDYWALVNTALDTCVNLFLLEKDGITADQSAYLSRQASRVNAIMKELDGMELIAPATPIADWSDPEVRLACFIQWAEFRDRVKISDYANLAKWASEIRNNQALMRTYPEVK